MMFETPGKLWSWDARIGYENDLLKHSTHNVCTFIGFAYFIIDMNWSPKNQQTFKKWHQNEGHILCVSLIVEYRGLAMYNTSTFIFIWNVPPKIIIWGNSKNFERRGPGLFLLWKCLLYIHRAQSVKYEAIDWSKILFFRFLSRTDVLCCFTKPNLQNSFEGKNTRIVFQFQWIHNLLQLLLMVYLNGV